MWIRSHSWHHVPDDCSGHDLDEHDEHHEHHEHHDDTPSDHDDDRCFPHNDEHDEHDPPGRLRSGPGAGSR